MPHDPRRSCRDRDKRSHHANQRGFACTVRSEQAEDLSLFYGERDIIDRGEVSIFFHDAVDLNGIAIGLAGQDKPGRHTLTDIHVGRHWCSATVLSCLPWSWSRETSTSAVMPG